MTSADRKRRARKAAKAGRLFVAAWFDEVALETVLVDARCIHPCSVDDPKKIAAALVLLIDRLADPALSISLSRGTMPRDASR